MRTTVLFVVALLLMASNLLAQTNHQARKFKSLIEEATVSLHTKKEVAFGIITIEGVGSGVVTLINGKKYVLTANHVIKGANSARLTSFKDGKSENVSRTAGWHEGYDIASIPLPRKLAHLKAVTLFNGQPPVGQPVYLSGFPKGQYRLTAGRVAGYNKNGTEMLHTAGSQPGASGGMLLSTSGSLFGINTGHYPSGSRFAGYSTGTPSSVVILLINRRLR